MDKNHAVEAIVKSSLEVLSKIEKSVNQQEILEKTNPILKSLSIEKKDLIEAGREALILISYLTAQRPSSGGYKKAALYTQSVNYLLWAVV